MRATLFFLCFSAPLIGFAQLPHAVKRFVGPDAFPCALGTTLVRSKEPISLFHPAGSPRFDVAHFTSPWRFHDLGVFCKLDVKLERWFTLPVLFRVGDVGGVEQMEGKGPYKALQ